MQEEVHANLTSKSFPFSHKELSSTVIINRGYDQNRTILPGFDGNEPVQQFGICQAYFMKNVLPILRGYTSVHAKQVIAGPTPAVDHFDRMFILRDASNNVALLSPARGKNWIYNPALASWISFDFGITLTDDISFAYLKGVTYVNYPQFGTYVYDFQTATYNRITLSGLVDVAIRGIASANNYLLAWTNDTLVWSSSTTPTDFVPSTITGAGSSQILSVRGNITCVLPLADGFVCYTTTNAVAATYSGNPLNPWIFKEVPNSSGVNESQHVTYDNNLGQHIAWTAGGMQVISFRGAEPLWPELSDSLAKRVYTTLNNDDLLLNRASNLRVRVNYVANRYVIVSIGNPATAPTPSLGQPVYQIAYIWDAALERWGRIDVDHVDVFEFRPPDFADLTLYSEFVGTYAAEFVGTYAAECGIPLGATAATFGTTFGFCNQAGKVTTYYANDAVEVDSLTNDYSSVIWLGRYKLTRPLGVALHEVFARHINLASAQLTAVAHDGSGNKVSTDALTELEDPQISELGRYPARLSGDSISLQLAGRFTLTDLSLMLTPYGRRNQPRGSAQTYGLQDQFDNFLTDQNGAVLTDHRGVIV